jgi:hypothetical protein
MTTKGELEEAYDSLDDQYTDLSRRYQELLKIYNNLLSYLQTNKSESYSAWLDSKLSTTEE